MMNMKSWKRTLVVLFTLLATVFAIAGCGGGSKDGGAKSAGSSSADGFATISPYVKATNYFNDKQATFSWQLSNTMERMRSGKDVTSIFLPNYEALQKDLKAATEKGSGYKDIDENAQAVLKSLEEMVPLAKDMNRYYDSKEFQADSHAKGREFVKKYLTLYDQFRTQYSALDNAMQVHLKELNEKRIEEYKKAGKMNAAAMSEISRDMETLVDSMKPTGMTDAEKQAAEKLISQVNANLDALKVTGDQANKVESYKKKVTSAIGGMRNAMSKPNDSNRFNSMIRDYNSYISESNGINREALDK